MPSEHRLHPTSILFALAGSLKAFWLPALLLWVTSGRLSPDPEQSGGPAGWMNWWLPGDFEISNWQFWLLLIMIPSVIVAISRYLSFRLRYEGTELVIRSGIVFRNERHVPYVRIQNLDAVRNVAHRLLGVAEVRVETGGGEAPEATISVLHETVFEEMRRRIFEGRTRSTVPGLDQESKPEAVAPVLESRTLLRLTIPELLLHGVLDNRGMLVVAAAFGVVWQAGLSDLVWNRVAGDWFGSGLVRTTTRALAGGGMPALGRVAALLAWIATLLVLVRVLSMAWSGLRLYQYRLSRVGEDLRTEYGLLTRVTTTIPLRRVQTLTIREAPLQRLMKRMSVRVETAGGHETPHEGPKQPREWLAPIIRRSDVPELVREVFPSLELGSLDWQPLHPGAFRRAVKPALLLAFVSPLPLVAWFGWWAFASLPFIVAAMTIATRKHVQHTNWAITEDAVAFRSGWMWRHVTVAPIAKIQTVASLESLFDRRHAMASVQVDTAGTRSHPVSIPYLARETAESLYNRLAVQAAQTAFRW